MTSLPPPTPDQRVEAPNLGSDSVVAVSPWLRLGAYVLEVVLMTVTLGIGWIIWAMFTVREGQTPAKRLLRQRVVGADDRRPVGFARMFWMRGLVAGLVAGLLVPLTLGILLLMPLWDKRNQNLWDKVSGTLVVEA